MKKELWLRLRQYHFAEIVPPHMWDHVTAAFGGADASTRAFASKVARKHGWTTRFAVRAINEYRKFVYLGVTAEFIVTPSKVIDTVWHEHLLFTRAYREFCRDVLRRDFDHHPQLMPVEEQTVVYAQQYTATLARYETEFHMIPPDDIWGTTKFRQDRTSTTSDSGAAVGDSGDTPLYMLFNGLGDTPGHYDMAEFGGGGGFSGGGGGDDWGGDSHGDGGSGDSGSSGDSGGDGGSGCSSGCGGE